MGTRVPIKTASIPATRSQLETSVLLVHALNTIIMATTANQPSAEVTNNAVVTDGDILGKTDISQVEAVQIASLTEEEKAIEKKLVLRIDLIIFPLLITVYLLNWIDRYALVANLAAQDSVFCTDLQFRNNYAAARLQGLEDDLSMSPQQYQTGLSILFVGYILGSLDAKDCLVHSIG